MMHVLYFIIFLPMTAVTSAEEDVAPQVEVLREGTTETPGVGAGEDKADERAGAVHDVEVLREGTAETPGVGAGEDKADERAGAVHDVEVLREGTAETPGVGAGEDKADERAGAVHDVEVLREGTAETPGVGAGEDKADERAGAVHDVEVLREGTAETPGVGAGEDKADERAGAVHDVEVLREGTAETPGVGVGEGKADERAGAVHDVEVLSEGAAETPGVGVGEDKADGDKHVQGNATAPVSIQEDMEEPTSGFFDNEFSAYLGADRIIVKYTRIGVALGVERLEDIIYLPIEPLVDLRFFDGKLIMGFGVPLRIELVNLALIDVTGDSDVLSNSGTIRVEDWDSVHDYARILKYIKYGRKGTDPLYISIGQRYATSIGHGAITRRYAPNISIDYPRVSAAVDAHNRYAGFELMVNDVLEWNQLSGLVFLKPFAFLQSAGRALKSLSVGFSGGLDWKAPYALSRDEYGLQIDSERRFVTQNRTLGIIGANVEIKALKTRHVDLKTYIDYSQLVGGDFGITTGLLGRFNWGQGRSTNNFRLVLEGRYLGNHYQPSYFDTFYEVDRYVFQQGSKVSVPKQRYVLENGLGERFGYYAEASWGIPKAVWLTMAVQGVSNTPATDFIAHLEVPILDVFQIFGSYYVRGVESLADLGYDENLQGLGLFADNAVIFTGFRLKILPFFFLNGRLYKTFRVNTARRRYENQFGMVVDLEIGYEFRK